MAEKNEEENITKYQSTDRHNIRMEFWAQLLKGIKEDKSFNLFDNINPSKDNYIEASSSIPNVGYVFRVTKDYVRIELCIHNSNKEYNEYIFDQLYKSKENIENVFEQPLEWQRRNNIKYSNIIYKLENVNIFNTAYWKKVIEFL